MRGWADPEAHVEANYKSEGPDELHANLFQQVPQARRKKGRGEMFCVTILCARLCDLIRFDACQFFGQLRWVAADHLGLLRPAKTSIWSGDADWDANLRTCAPGFFVDMGQGSTQEHLKTQRFYVCFMDGWAQGPFATNARKFLSLVHFELLLRAKDTFQQPNWNDPEKAGPGKQKSSYSGSQQPWGAAPFYG